MGREQAAVAIAVVSIKDPGHFRRTPGGYFHGMVAKAKAGELNLGVTTRSVQNCTLSRDAGTRYPNRLTGAWVRA